MIDLRLLAQCVAEVLQERQETPDDRRILDETQQIICEVLAGTDYRSVPHEVHYKDASRIAATRYIQAIKAVQPPADMASDSHTNADQPPDKSERGLPLDESD